jgi:hypothetical protein
MAEIDWSLARHMRESAEMMRRAADDMEEAHRRLDILFDATYGSAAPRLIELLEGLDGKVLEVTKG